MREILRAIVSASFMLNLAIIATTLASSVVQAEPPVPDTYDLTICTDCYSCVAVGEDCIKNNAGVGCSNLSAMCKCILQDGEGEEEARRLCKPKSPRP